jgi:hypothetical protein
MICREHGVTPETSAAWREGGERTGNYWGVTIFRGDMPSKAEVGGILKFRQETLDFGHKMSSLTDPARLILKTQSNLQRGIF